MNYAYLQQFSIGPALAGAQPHFHGDAFNLLVYGAKRWLFNPPSFGRFNLNTALSEIEKLYIFQSNDFEHFVESRERMESSSNQPDAHEGMKHRDPSSTRDHDNHEKVVNSSLLLDEYLERMYSYECIQESGEIMYVPELYSHMTLLLQDSLGVALEFS